MTTYIDLASLGPSPGRRARELALSGRLVPELWRFEVLLQAKDGDVVICGPLALNFWRKLPAGARLYSIADLDATDPDRFDTWEEWGGVQAGLTRTDAKRCVKAPPKALRHQHYWQWNQAQARATVACFDHKRRPTLPEFELIEGPAATSHEMPYKWYLVDDDPTAIANAEALLMAAAAGNQRVGLDVETDVKLDHVSEMHDDLVGVAIAFGKDVYYGTYREGWREVLVRFANKLRWVGHNAKYDYTVLRRADCMVASPVGDSLLAAYLLGVPEAGLKKLVRDRYGVQMITYQEVVGEGKRRKRMADVEPKVVAPYCCGDAYWALRCTNDLEAELAPQQRQLYDLDIKLSHVVAGMQEHGIDFDTEAARKLEHETKESMDRYAQTIDDLAVGSGFVRPPKTWVCGSCRNGKNKRLICADCKGVGKFSGRQPINPGSPQQVGAWLHDHLKLPVQALTPGGVPSVDALMLLRLKQYHVGVYALLRWRQMQKLLGYLESWLSAAEPDGKLHTVFTLGRTRSGRFSSEDPNLQQVRLEWRKLFVALPGEKLLAADYGQIELRIPAKASGDPALVAAMLADPKRKEGDIHGQNVEWLFNVPYHIQQEPAFDKTLRVRAKNYIFGAIYGSEGKEVKLALEKQMLLDDTIDLPVPSEREIYRDIMRLRERYPVYFYEWVPAAIAKCKDNGGWAYTLFGRPRYIPEILDSDKYKRKHAERQCVSHITQGTAADIMRFALVKLAEYCKDFPELALLLSIHDEVVISGPEDCLADHAPQIESIMQLGQPLDPIPLTVDIGIGDNWYECYR